MAGNGLLADKVGLVTGAAQGLGRAVAELAAREGSRVVVSDVQVERGEAAARAIQDAGGDAIFVEADVSDAGQVEALVDRSVSHFGRLDWRATTRSAARATSVRCRTSKIATGTGPSTSA